MDKLGFTFYPKDWWTSESYFELTPIQRYYYLECLFIMYSNDGCMKTQKTQFENRIRTQVLDSDWNFVTERFILENGFFTHQSVNKRLRKTLTNRENGKKGGRPKKEEEKPKKPKTETQKNPPLEREREREEENKTEKEIEIKKENKNEFFLTELSNSHSWLETISMQNKLKLDETKLWLNKFNLHLESTMEEKSNKKDFASHFVNWLKFQETKQKQEVKPKYKCL